MLKNIRQYLRCVRSPGHRSAIHAARNLVLDDLGWNEDATRAGLRCKVGKSE